MSIELSDQHLSSTLSSSLWTTVSIDENTQKSGQFEEDDSGRCCSTSVGSREEKILARERTPVVDGDDVRKKKCSDDKDKKTLKSGVCRNGESKDEQASVQVRKLSFSVASNEATKGENKSEKVSVENKKRSKTSRRRSEKKFSTNEPTNQVAKGSKYRVKSDVINESNAVKQNRKLGPAKRGSRDQAREEKHEMLNCGLLRKTRVHGASDYDVIARSTHRKRHKKKRQYDEEMKEVSDQKDEPVRDRFVIQIDSPPQVDIGFTRRRKHKTVEENRIKKSEIVSRRRRFSEKMNATAVQSHPNSERREKVKIGRQEVMRSSHMKENKMTKTLGRSLHHHHCDKKLTSSDEGLPRSPPKVQVEADEIKMRKTQLCEIHSTVGSSHKNPDLVTRSSKTKMRSTAKSNKKNRSDLDRYKTSKTNGFEVPLRCKSKPFHMQQLTNELSAVSKGKDDHPTTRPKRGYERWLRIDNQSNASSNPSTSSSYTSSVTSGSYLSYTCKTDASDSSYGSQSKSQHRAVRRVCNVRNGNRPNTSDSDNSDDKFVTVPQNSRKSTSNIVHQRKVSVEEQKRSSRFRYEPETKKNTIKRNGGQYSSAEHPHLGTRRERPSRLSAKAEDEDCHSRWQHHHLVVVSQKPGDSKKQINSLVTKPDHKFNNKTASSKFMSSTKKSVTIRDLYSLHNVLSDTQNGTVIAGYRRSDGLRVAIKRISKSATSRWGWLSGKVVPLELTLLCQVNETRGNGVVEILEWHETNEAFLLVMVRPHPAVDLYDYVSKHRRLRETLARHIGRQLIAALQHCKSRGVLHRDVKLENILFNPETHELTLIDFGCGDYVRSSCYKEFAGTPEYYPPEWFLKKQYDGDSLTVWSIGILLYSIICGCLPFRSPKDISEREITKFPSDVSNSARDLLLKMLKKSPRDRLTFSSLLTHSWFSSQSYRSLGDDK